VFANFLSIACSMNSNNWNLFCNCFSIFEMPSTKTSTTFSFVAVFENWNAFWKFEGSNWTIPWRLRWLMAMFEANSGLSVCVCVFVFVCVCVFVFLCVCICLFLFVFVFVLVIYHLHIMVDLSNLNLKNTNFLNKKN